MQRSYNIPALCVKLRLQPGEIPVFTVPIEPKLQPAINPASLNAVEFAEQILRFHPDPTQVQIMLSQSKRILLNCTRQWGKSTTTAAIAAHRLLTGPAGNLTLVVAPCARQSAETVRKIEHFVRIAGHPTKGDGENSASILMPNGSRVVGLPGTDGTIRGFSAVSLLIVDEAARVDDDTYNAVKPMLATSGGAIMLLSTPNGQRGFFYKAWSSEPDWERFTVNADDCPRISKSFLAEQRISYDANTYRQEFLCEFHAADNATFDPEWVHGALAENEIPWEFPGVF